jgi:hypothetical protein
MFSISDDPALRVLGPSSRVEAIGSVGVPVLPPASIFGAEPAHGWCFHFEKAALASQQGNWQEVAAIQDEVAKLGLHPNDQIEWMPFLQAQAYLGNLKAVREISTRINTEKAYKQQACQNLVAMARHGYSLPPDAQAYGIELFCDPTP